VTRYILYPLLRIFDAEVPADFPGQVIVDLAMSWHRRPGQPLEGTAAASRPRAWATARSALAVGRPISPALDPTLMAWMARDSTKRKERFKYSDPLNLNLSSPRRVGWHRPGAPRARSRHPSSPSSSSSDDAATSTSASGRRCRGKNAKLAISVGITALAMTTATR